MKITLVMVPKVKTDQVNENGILSEIRIELEGDAGLMGSIMKDLAPFLKNLL